MQIFGFELLVFSLVILPCTGFVVSYSWLFPQHDDDIMFINDLSKLGMINCVLSSFLSIVICNSYYISKEHLNCHTYIFIEVILD